MDTEGQRQRLEEPCHTTGHGCLFPPAGTLLTITKAEWEQESVQLILFQDKEQPEARPPGPRCRAVSWERLKEQLNCYASSGQVWKNQEPSRLSNMAVCLSGWVGPVSIGSLQQGLVCTSLWDRRKNGRGFPSGTLGLSSGRPASPLVLGIR